LKKKEMMPPCDLMKQKSIKLAEDYQRLYDEHCRLRSEFCRTWKAGAGLFRLTELFGHAYLNQILEPSEYVAQITAFTPKVVKSSVPDFTETPPPILSKFVEDMHYELIRRQALKIVNDGKGKKVEDLRKIVSNLPLDDSFQKVADSVEKAPDEVLSMLSDKKKVGAVFQEMLDDIKGETKNDIEGFGKYLGESLERIKGASTPILCKVKRAQPSQTFQARKNDIETQYNKADIPKGRKGK